jgi:hypothetical protein
MYFPKTHDQTSLTESFIGLRPEHETNNYEQFIGIKYEAELLNS